MKLPVMKLLVELLGMKRLVMKLPVMKILVKLLGMKLPMTKLPVNLLTRTKQLVEEKEVVVADAK